MWNTCFLCDPQCVVHVLLMDLGELPDKERLFNQFYDYLSVFNIISRHTFILFHSNSCIIWVLTHNHSFGKFKLILKFFAKYYWFWCYSFQVKSVELVYILDTVAMCFIYVYMYGNHSNYLTSVCMCDILPSSISEYGSHCMLPVLFYYRRLVLVREWMLLWWTSS